MKMHKLKPCPFCGSEMAVIQNKYPVPGVSYNYMVVCTNGTSCPINPQTPYCFSEKDAESCWNNATKKHKKTLKELHIAFKQIDGQYETVMDFIRIKYPMVYDDVINELTERKKVAKNDRPANFN